MLSPAIDFKEQFGLSLAHLFEAGGQIYLGLTNTADWSPLCPGGSLVWWACLQLLSKVVVEKKGGDLQPARVGGFFILGTCLVLVSGARKARQVPWNKGSSHQDGLRSGMLCSNISFRIRNSCFKSAGPDTPGLKLEYYSKFYPIIYHFRR